MQTPEQRGLAGALAEDEREQEGGGETEGHTISTIPSSEAAARNSPSPLKSRDTTGLVNRGMVATHT